MKILIIAGIFPPDIGGPAQYVPKISDALVKKGHKVSVLCFSDVHVNPEDQKLSYPVVRINRHTNILIRELSTIWTGLKLAFNCDVVYSNGNDFKAFLIALIANKKTVHKIVGDTAWERSQNRGWYLGTLDEYQIAQKSIFLNVLDWLKIFPLRKSHSVITPSNYLKKIVTGWDVSPENVKVVYNSFQPLPFITTPPASLSEKKISLKYMCTICRIVPWKGIDQLLEALVTFPGLGLIIVGDGPLENTFKDLAQKLGVADRTIFAGRQSRDSIRSFLNASDFFILNSSYEGLPHVVLEAMSCERLVLASNVGGTPEVVKHSQTGLLFEYGNKTSLCAAIENALKNEHSHIIKNAKHFIETEFSFEKMMNDTEAQLFNAR